MDVLDKFQEELHDLIFISRQMFISRSTTKIGGSVSRRLFIVYLSANWNKVFGVSFSYTLKGCYRQYFIKIFCINTFLVIKEREEMYEF